MISSKRLSTALLSCCANKLPLLLDIETLVTELTIFLSTASTHANETSEQKDMVLLEWFECKAKLFQDLKKEVECYLPLLKTVVEIDDNRPLKRIRIRTKSGQP